MLAVLVGAHLLAVGGRFHVLINVCDQGAVGFHAETVLVFHVGVFLGGRAVVPYHTVFRSVAHAGGGSETVGADITDGVKTAAFGTAAVRHVVVERPGHNLVNEIYHRHHQQREQCVSTPQYQTHVPVISRYDADHCGQEQQHTVAQRIERIAPVHQRPYKGHGQRAEAEYPYQLPDESEYVD